MNALWLDTTRGFGQAGRVDVKRALSTRPGLGFLSTTSGRIRVRRQPSERGPRLLMATDGPNVVEHADALFAALKDTADVVLFEPPGTGASEPPPGFDFSLEAFTRVCGEVLEQVGPRTLVFPCYLGFVGQALARGSRLVTRLVTPQTPSWEDLARWADGVDPRRLVRTPVVGQLFVSLARRRVAAGWYRACTGDRSFREPFTAAAVEAFHVGGCFCLASLMQGLERSAAPSRTPLSVPTAIVWGARDRTHRRSDPVNAFPGAELIRFEQCGHSPDLEAPQAFAAWLLGWHGGAA